MYENSKKLTAVYAAAALLLVITAIVGTFCDKALSDAVYKAADPFFLTISILGQYVFYGSMVFFGGALLKQISLNDGLSAGKKLAASIFCVLGIIEGAFLGSGSLTHAEGLGAIEAFAKLPKYPARFGTMLIVMLPLMICGMKLTKEHSKKLTGRLVRLMIIALIVQIAIMSTKGFFARPRYRTTLMGFDGVGFVQWYEALGDPKPLSEKFGVDKNAFQSFPSGHSWMAAASMYIIMGLSAVIKKLEGKEVQLTIAGLVFALAIMFSRIVLGAHYLSDISFGGLLGTITGFIFLKLELRADKNLQ
ncbi:phosphatase PAP2 family protein [uncultured Ruminococcus sp.]|uniref:phosphatase PAP2 family protein n=1 Tax=uncultured Ruminococcus sp. TaxID=165186 RepID=UPI000ECC77FE|nr:phosphatase PAP2 family protein [uncultured Ruminococcus sp.]HCJ41369.1 hypothetical protein [Ruminococcus sp.]